MIRRPHVGERGTRSTGTAERRRWWLLSLCSRRVAAWSLGTPQDGLTSGQAVRSAAAACGHVLGTPVDGHNGFARMRISGVFADSHRFGACFEGIFRDADPIRVAPPLRSPCRPIHGSRALMTSISQQNRNPPIYPIVLGLPSLVLPNQVGMYLMRPLAPPLRGERASALVRSSGSPALASPRSRVRLAHPGAARRRRHGLERWSRTVVACSLWASDSRRRRARTGRSPRPAAPEWPS